MNPSLKQTWLQETSFFCLEFHLLKTMALSGFRAKIFEIILLEKTWHQTQNLTSEDQKVGYFLVLRTALTEQKHTLLYSSFEITHVPLGAPCFLQHTRSLSVMTFFHRRVTLLHDKSSCHRHWTFLGIGQVKRLQTNSVFSGTKQLRETVICRQSVLWPFVYLNMLWKMRETLGDPPFAFINQWKFGTLMPETIRTWRTWSMQKLSVPVCWSALMFPEGHIWSRAPLG